MKQLRSVKKNVITNDGVINGSVTYRIRFHPFAPSIEAASSTSFGRETNPAMKISIMYPLICQIVTITIAKKAKVASPSQPKRRISMPSRCPIAGRLCTKINCQI